MRSFRTSRPKNGPRPRRATTPGRANRPGRSRELAILLAGALFGGFVTAAVGYTTGFADVGDRTNWASEPSESTPEPAAPAPDPVTITVSGDLLWHPAVWEGAMLPDGGWDFTGTYANISPILHDADLAICHQETAFAPWEGPYEGYPMFHTPPQVAQGIKDAGWDMCTVASNHTMDWGPEGMYRTLDGFDQVGIIHSGAARSPEEAATPRIFTTEQGVRVAVVTGTYGTNGMPVPEPWMINDLDPDAMLARAAEARAAGADIVLAALHAGDEGVTEPNAQQAELADILTRSPDIDAVYGHHIHAVQPTERVNGKWVVYGLGNHIAQQLAENTLAFDGITVRFSFVPREGGGWEVGELTYIPTIISPPGVFPVQGAPISSLLGREDIDQEWLHASLERTRAAVFSRGTSPDEIREG